MKLLALSSYIASFLLTFAVFGSVILSVIAGVAVDPMWFLYTPVGIVASAASWLLTDATCKWSISL